MMDNQVLFGVYPGLVLERVLLGSGYVGVEWVLIDDGWGKGTTQELH